LLGVRIPFIVGENGLPGGAASSEPPSPGLLPTQDEPMPPQPLAPLMLADRHEWSRTVESTIGALLAMNRVSCRGAELGPKLRCVPPVSAVPTRRKATCGTGGPGGGPCAWRYGGGMEGSSWS
jgi:hypothetical protein